MGKANKMIARILVAIIALVTATCMTSARVPAQTASPPPKAFSPIGFLVRVYNKSTTCAWVSVGYSLPLLPWKWMSGTSSARFIHPGKYYDFSAAIFQLLPSSAEVKVEGTFMEHADCTGAHAREITRINYAINVHSVPPNARATGMLTGQNRETYHVDVTDGISP